MTKIYVLTSEPRGYDDDRQNLNVFSSYELAVAWVTNNYPEYVHRNIAKYGQFAYDIEEYTLDAN